MKSYIIKKLHRKSTRKILAIGGISTISTLFVLSAIFFLTRGSHPHSDELAYSEKSNTASVAGAVVPASCDSAPPTNHFAGDCPNPTISVTGLPASMAFGSPKSDISWTTTGSQGCALMINGSLFSNVGPSGTLPALTYKSTTDFEFICSNTVGVTTSSGILKLTISPKVQLNPGTNNTPTATVVNEPMGPTTLTTDMSYVAFGEAPTLSWNAPGATSCFGSGSWSDVKSAPSGTQSLTSYTGTKNTSKTYILSCTNNISTTTDSVVISYEGSYFSGCFTAGTKVLLGNGTRKNIEDVTLDDSLMTSAGPQEVMKTYRIAYTGKLYAFNNSKNYFVTPTHPFMTTEGWKSLNPAGTRRESPGITVSKLSIGDSLVLEGGRYMTLTALDSIATSTTVYNFGVNGTHDFYADEYLVHNVSMKDIFEKVYAAPAKLPY